MTSRIVLVDPLGEVLFSGASSMARARARAAEPAPPRAAAANESTVVEGSDEAEVEIER